MKEDSNNVHGYRSDYKLKVIGSEQTHSKKELQQIDLQQIIVLRIKKRGSHLVTAYGPVGLWWTTHTSSKRHQRGC